MRILKFKNIFAGLIMVSAYCCGGQDDPGKPIVDPTKPVTFDKPLFKAGDDGYNTYRIPAIAQSKSGKLLAFVEARKNGTADNGDIDVGLKTSDDDGKTWSDMRVIMDDYDNTCGNPTPVIIESTGRIVLFACWQRTATTAAAFNSDLVTSSEAFQSNKNRRVFVLYSDNDGLTWTAPEDMTSSLKQSDWNWYATGPCHAMQKKMAPRKGRIIIPANHRDNGNTDNYAHIIYSDDDGATWTLGQTIRPVGGNESCAVELSNGDIMLAMRNANIDTYKCRAYAISSDGGDTFGAYTYEPQLPDPGCQGSVVNYSWTNTPSDIILCTNPASATSRVKMTLSISRDDGKTWDKRHTIYAGRSAYSDIVVTNDGGIVILYENGISGNYEQISCTYMPAAAVKEIIEE
jgi:sialidase-1